MRALVNHVVGEQRWAPHLLAGETIEKVGDRYDGDLLGDDLHATWSDAVGPAVAAFAEPGALDRTVHLSYGDEAAREYATQMLTDLAIHGWDLARATGGDEYIDPEVAQLLWDAWAPPRNWCAAAASLVRMSASPTTHPSPPACWDSSDALRHSCGSFVRGPPHVSVMHGRTVMGQSITA